MPRSESGFAAHLELLGGFHLFVSGVPIRLTPGEERLLAFLVLADRPVSRGYVAGSLWPDVHEHRALARLRTGLWRLNRRIPGLTSVDAHRLGAGKELVVDVHSAREAAIKLLGQGSRPARADIGWYESDILPDWDDEWLDAQRMSFRLLRLRALEAIAQERLDCGDAAGAERAALAVVDAEPLRETAHMLLANVYVGEGNLGQAVQQLAWYQGLLKSELGVAPSTRVQHLVAAIRSR